MKSALNLKTKYFSQCTRRLLLLTTAFFLLGSLSAEAQGIPRSRARMVVAKPDLQVSISVVPTPKGELVPTNAISSLSVEVSNTGNAPAVNFYVQAYITPGATSRSRTRFLSSPSSGRQMLIEGKKHINSLRAGGEKKLSFAVRNKIPKGTPTGENTLIVFADATQKVTESNESNNTAMVKVYYQPIHIDSVRFTYEGHNDGDVSIEVNGTGFGASQGNKIVKVGTQPMTIYTWTNTRIHGFVTLNQVNLGQTYPVYLVDQTTNQGISNQVSLKILSRIYWISPPQGAPGTSIMLLIGNRSTAQGTTIFKIGTAQAPIVHWAGGEGVDITVPNLPPGNYEFFMEDLGKVISQKATFTVL